MLFLGVRFIYFFYFETYIAENGKTLTVVNFRLFFFAEPGHG